MRKAKRFRSNFLFNLNFFVFHYIQWAISFAHEDEDVLPLQSRSHLLNLRSVDIRQRIGVCVYMCAIRIMSFALPFRVITI